MTPHGTRLARGIYNPCVPHNEGTFNLPMKLWAQRDILISVNVALWRLCVNSVPAVTYTVRIHSLCGTISRDVSCGRLTDIWSKEIAFRDTQYQSLAITSTRPFRRGRFKLRRSSAPLRWQFSTQQSRTLAHRKG